MLCATLFLLTSATAAPIQVAEEQAGTSFIFSMTSEVRPPTPSSDEAKTISLARGEAEAKAQVLRSAAMHQWLRERRSTQENTANWTEAQWKQAISAYLTNGSRESRLATENTLQGSRLLTDIIAAIGTDELAELKATTVYSTRAAGLEKQLNVLLPKSSEGPPPALRAVLAELGPEAESLLPNILQQLTIDFASLSELRLVVMPKVDGIDFHLQLVQGRLEKGRAVANFALQSEVIVAPNVSALIENYRASSLWKEFASNDWRTWSYVPRHKWTKDAPFHLWSEVQAIGNQYFKDYVNGQTVVLNERLAYAMLSAASLSISAPDFIKQQLSAGNLIDVTVQEQRLLLPTDWNIAATGTSREIFEQAISFNGDPLANCALYQGVAESGYPYDYPLFVNAASGVGLLYDTGPFEMPVMKAILGNLSQNQFSELMGRGRTSYSANSVSQTNLLVHLFETWRHLVTERSASPWPSKRLSASDQVTIERRTTELPRYEITIGENTLEGSIDNLGFLLLLGSQSTSQITAVRKSTESFEQFAVMTRSGEELVWTAGTGSKLESSELGSQEASQVIEQIEEARRQHELDHQSRVDFYRKQIKP